ncbi:MBL fold metallo-hydrolase [Acaryochloris sp. IP29b_bin.148]|uniref:MBL fold metallo-hydrolase n=1 Tax=Acaryochloris sp. IP29b_bin.148 TaxID=2969218 RepID=UPI00263892BA|nr:MBL fold metallo-hydrolase [Acaryochloris sp. IP29b_bin.148]
MKDIENLRIHFYGVQGSGSIYPSLQDRQAYQKVTDCELLNQVFTNLQQQTGPEGRLNATIEELIGGPLNRKTLEAYRAQFDMPTARIYGGWTTCIRIETADGFDIVLDCGSGFRVCAKDIVKKWRYLEGDGQNIANNHRHLYIFGSHSHYDHTEGFDQAAVCFDPCNHIHVYANRQYLQALDQILGIFSHQVDFRLKGVQTPLSYELMPAHFYAYEIRDFQVDPPSPAGDKLVHQYHDLSQHIQIGETTLYPFEVFHPSPCLAYRIERGGKVFIFCTDHELRRGLEPDHPLQIASLEAEERLCQQSVNADVLYRDGQFLRIEYDGDLGIGSPYGISRLDWGHSCIEDVLDMAVRCQVKHTFIGHHDPNRDWLERNWWDETLQRKSEQTGLNFELAQAETVIDL